MIYTLTLNPAVDLELTASSLRFNEVNRATDSRKDCGGKGLNVSRMLKNLGFVSTAMGFTGGKSGEWIEAQMDSLGIAVDFTPIAGETRTNVSFVAADEGNHIKVNDPGPSVSQGEFDALLDRVREKAAAGDWWVLAGSLPQGVSKDAYGRLVEIIQSAGGHVLLDTSGEALRLAAAAGPTLVKPNLEEAQEILGDTTLPASACIEQISGLGPKQVVISLGKDGVAFSTDGGAATISSPKIVEKNPTGAGDSLVAGLVFSLNRGDSLADAVRFGAACGAATASLPGTELGSLQQVNDLLATMQ
ncbi:1-phosphofructokinase [uncultured Cohaesibacter sp.]|uniref:1-phosphofructokinase n=1 Tax=uncultured Cohaesibacter sp. TaxID=1002546 RepID=UPI0029C78B22|nr:1-phosphofructokinase [uncultured Cohaesibacter sp.]